MAGFSIGVSQIGEPPFDWYKETVASQYANSPAMMALLGSMSDAIDQIPNLDAFYDFMWNIFTAKGYGLDVWGRIVCARRTVEGIDDFFGFVEGDWEPFNIEKFYSGTLSTFNFVLTDDAFRLVILAKALANVNAGTIPEMNRVLQLLFPGRGNCYVTNEQDLTMKYVFEFPLLPFEIAVVTTADVLQRPAGVSRTFVIPPIYGDR